MPISTLIANIELLVMCELFISVMYIFRIREWLASPNHPYRRIYQLVMAGTLLEMAAFYSDGKPGLIWLNYVSNTLYLASIGGMGPLFLIHCSSLFPKPLWKTRKGYALLMIPFMIEMILLATAFKTGLIFQVDADGFYHRSSTFYFQFIPYGYMICASITGLYWYFRTETTRERMQYLTVGLFSIPPLFLGGIQVLVPPNSLDIMEFSIVLSILIDFAISQNNKITRDPLTRLPNRATLDHVLKEKMSPDRRKDGMNLYVLMGDLDGFKSINDTYGHLEGDKALIITGDILYNIASEYHGTAARFGGDEFTIVVEAPNDTIPREIIRRINEELARQCENTNLKLAMSIGYARRISTDTIHELLKSADRELYMVKQQRHTMR